MGVFDDHNAPIGEYTKANLAQECKPDYEKIISDLKQKHSRTSELFEAINNYVGITRGSFINKTFTLSQLVGYLYLEVNYLTAAIEENIKLQEKD